LKYLFKIAFISKPKPKRHPELKIVFIKKREPNRSAACFSKEFFYIQIEPAAKSKTAIFWIALEIVKITSSALD